MNFVELYSINRSIRSTCLSVKRASDVSDRNEAAYKLYDDEPPLVVIPPQQPAQKPQQPAQKPQQPAQKPQQPAQKPQQPAQKPQQPAQKPQQPAPKTDSASWSDSISNAWKATKEWGGWKATSDWAVNNKGWLIPTALLLAVLGGAFGADAYSKRKKRRNAGYHDLEDMA